MPLEKGTSKAAFQHNVRELYNNGTKKRGMKQILAIAYAEQRRSRKKK